MSQSRLSRPWSGLLPVLLAAILALTITDTGCAEDADAMIGQQVFVRESAKPRNGDKTLLWNQVPLPATVTRVNGNWLWLGNAWVQRKDVVPADDAPAYYTQIIRRDPRAAYAYMLRGVAWGLERDYDNAIKDFTTAMRIEPGVHAAHHARAAAYHAIHEYEKALADISEAIRLAPEIALYYNDRGCIYNSLDEYEKAHDEFNRAVRVDPKLALAYANRGVNFYDEKHYDKALADFEKALSINGALTHAYNHRGYVWSKIGRFGKALDDWDESIRIAPYEPWAYMNKARLWATSASLGQRNGRAALEAAKKACELAHGDDWLCTSALAAAYAECGKFDEAVRWQKKAIAMNKHPEEKDRINSQERLDLYQSGKPYVDPELSQDEVEEEVKVSEER